MTQRWQTHTRKAYYPKIIYIILHNKKHFQNKFDLLFKIYEVSLHHIVTFSPCHDLYIAPPPIFEAAKCKSTCLLIIENKKKVLFDTDD